MIVEVWQQTLAELPVLYQLFIADNQIALTVTNSFRWMLTLAYTTWQQGKQSHWSEIAPYYGQHPIS